MGDWQAERVIFEMNGNNRKVLNQKNFCVFDGCALQEIEFAGGWITFLGNVFWHLEIALLQIEFTGGWITFLRNGFWYLEIVASTPRGLPWD